MKKVFDTEKKLYTLSLLVKDIPGVLSQVARLFSRKGYNIESIVSGGTEQPGTTRITKRSSPQRAITARISSTSAAAATTTAPAQSAENGAMARTMAGMPRSGRNTLLRSASMRRPLPPPKMMA